MAPSWLGSSLLLFAIAAAAPRLANAQACDSTFLDAIGGGDTLLFRKGLELAGYADKLPSPEIGVTILVPNNKAWWDFLWKNGFLLDQLSSVGDKLLSVMTFHIIPSAVTPEMLSSTPEGKLPTLFGLLSGQSADLLHWPKFTDGQFLFQGPWDDTIAGVSGQGVQVCNSWVYVIDEVLIPAYNLDDVVTVQIPDFAFGDNSTPSPSPSPSPSPATPAPASPAPASPAPASPAPASPAPTTATPAAPSSPAAPGPPTAPACDKTFAQVAGETSGLNLLKTVLSLDQYSSALPDPSANYTLFAPTDAAFFALLKTFNLSVTDALALGDKLTAVLLYHVVPGALTPEQLKQEDKLTTGLALKTDNGGYTLTVNGAGEQTTVAGNFPGNTANIASNLSVCSSQVYVIDQVLIPAGSLAAIPAVTGGLDPQQAAAAAVSSPSPAPTPAPAPAPVPAAASSPPLPSPAAAPVGDAEAAAITEVTGLALATGYLAGCNVQLSSAGGPPQNTTTDSSGQFSFSCASSDCTGEVLSLLASGQPVGCGDSLTQLPPPFDLNAPVSALPDGITLATLSPLTSIIAAANAQSDQQAVPAPEPAPSNRKLLQRGPEEATLGGHQMPRRALLQEIDFGITSDESGNPTNISTAYGDPVAAALDGDQQAYNLIAKSQELVCTGSIGGSLLSSLTGGSATVASAAEAVFDQLARDLLAGSGFGLTDSSSLLQLYQRALAQLSESTTGATPAAGVNATAVTAAAADTVALLNSLLEEAVTAAEQNQLAEADKMVQVLARLSKVCQSDVGVKASQLGTGLLTVAAWQAEFSLPNISNLTISNTL
ncbi:hypothetical protein D9Q98_007066 [Chlorella vulgaris]|uniref:FAS1 domain-containing protein n=1 Tax=Chlorella vulgaris TaxID=3077 RepID=A0A9D4YUK7_CHLVU|nr:hypothetical protein D9Q98_007066 [Chlorella vulgaris]